MPYLLLLVAVLAGGWFLVTYYLNAGDIPLQLAPGTTLATEPLKRNGKEVDYFALLTAKFERPIPAAENGFRQVVAGLGKNLFELAPAPWYWEALCQKLEIDPQIKPEARLLGLADFLAEEYPDDLAVAEDDFQPYQKRKMLLEELTNVPWTLEQHPFMRRFLEVNGPALDRVSKAVQGEHFFCPRVRQDDTTMPPHLLDAGLTLAKRAIPIFAVRALQRAGSGDTVGASADAIALCRLGVFAANTPWSGSRVAGIDAVTLSTAVPIFRAVVAAESASQAALKERLDFWSTALERLPVDPYNAADVLFADQCEALDWIGAYANGRIELEAYPGLDRVIPPKNSGDGVDWNIVAQGIQRFFLEAMSLFQEPDPEKRDAMSEYAALLERRKAFKSGWSIPTRAARSESVGDAVGLYFCTSPKILMRLEERRNAWRSLLMLAVALEKYRLARGRYPKTLEELAPDRIPLIPGDPFTAGKPLHYRLEAAPNLPEPDPETAGKGYILYSVSLDRKDDGGYTQKELMRKTFDGDLRIRMPLDGFYFKEEKTKQE